MIRCRPLAALVLAAACAAAPELPQGWDPGQGIASHHDGPGVAPGSTGPARFVPALYAAFEEGRAMETAAFADRYYREPGNEGFEATLDVIVRELGRAGFGSDARLELEVIETPLGEPAWTPRSARLTLSTTGGETRVLHAFDTPEGRDRTMLPSNAPSADVSGAVVFDLALLAEGEVLVSDQPLGSILRRAGAKKPAAVLSSYLPDFNVDPTGAERHLEAIHYGHVRSGTRIPVAHISPRAYRTLQAARERGPRVSFQAVVELEERPLRTVVATIVGATEPGSAVAIAAHVQEPGACDNASGLAGLLEGARSAVAALRTGELPWPAQSVVFIWGDEIIESRIFLDRTEREVVAAFSSDMTGPSKEKTGAIALLERGKDPGALLPLPPDEHTPWGAGSVEADDLVPNGLSVVARCALADVSALVGGWETREHPWEGGSDHDVFLRRGIPAALFWHFTDFAYHTSLDRLEHLDPEELKRTTVALLAAAFAIADTQPGDLARYLETLKSERVMRLAAAAEAGEEQLGLEWQEWFTGARMWLRERCLDLPPD